MDLACLAGLGMPGALPEHAPLPAPVEGDATGDAWQTRAEFNPRTRRLERYVPDEAPGSLYRELSKWCNPEDLERQMQEAASRRGMTLPRSVWQQLKERKAAAKKKARTMALLS